MSIELLAMLGGGVSGFLMKLIASQAEAQQRQVDMMIRKQEVADASAEKAAARGGVLVRRVIAFTILFAMIVAPFIVAFFDIPVTVIDEARGGLLGFLGFTKPLVTEMKGFVLLPEVRQGMLALLGFYFGSSQVR
jgi:hypothetical protein